MQLDCKNIWCHIEPDRVTYKKVQGKKPLFISKISRNNCKSDIVENQNCNNYVVKLRQKLL